MAITTADSYGNRCRRCKRKLSDPNAQYGWRCAEILGVAENLNNSGDGAFNAYMNGIKEAKDFIKRNEINASGINLSKFMEAHSKQALASGMKNRRLWELANLDMLNLLETGRGGSASGKSQSPPLAKYLELMDLADKQGGRYTTAMLSGKDFIPLAGKTEKEPIKTKEPLQSNAGLEKDRDYYIGEDGRAYYLASPKLHIWNKYGVDPTNMSWSREMPEIMYLKTDSGVKTLYQGKDFFVEYGKGADQYGRKVVAGVYAYPMRSLSGVLYGEPDIGNGIGNEIICGFNNYTAIPGRHEGIDFQYKSRPVKADKEVHALVEGTVTNVKTSGDGLTQICIYDSTEDKTVVYMHTVPMVKTGDCIKAGDVIGLEWNNGTRGDPHETPYNNNVHTHVEVVDGRVGAGNKSSDWTLVNINPAEYWKKKGYIVK